MPGPYSPNHRLGTDGPPFIDPHPSQPIPDQPPYAGPLAGEPVEAAPPAAAYPGLLPPPVSYPNRRRRRLALIAVAALVLIAGLIVAIVNGGHSRPATSGPLSDATAKAAIQGYLDALEHRDTDTIVRNNLCGLYDAVHDRRSDQAVAKFNSDAFRKQFSEARVNSIDRIVYLSNYQARVLFSMHVKPSSGGARDQVQAVSDLLLQRNQVLVCSYVLRTAGSY